jgi:toxin ParE1/3/4
VRLDLSLAWVLRQTLVLDKFRAQAAASWPKTRKIAGCMSSYIPSPRAKADLNDIWDYSLPRWGLERTERYVRDIERPIEWVAEDPRRGRPCDDIRAGYAKDAVGSHVLFYRTIPNGIDIVRVPHSRMDFARHL